MKLVFLCLSIIYIDVRELDATNQTLLSRASLVTLLQKLCPRADVCRENQTTNIPKVTFKAGHGSCCTDCSCAPNCMEYGTCCFPEELQEPVGGSSSDIQSRCLLTTTSTENAENRLLQSFNMVTSLQHSSTDELSSTSTSCGDTKIAPWGSLYPVYSPKRKQIYKNNVCALADNVDDGKIWDAVLVCKKVFYDSDNLSDYCHVDFIYTGESKDLQPLQCFDYITQTCSKSTYRIPRDIEEYSYEAIDEACTSGLVSPFRYITLEQFANVFCYICNVDNFPDEIHVRSNRYIHDERYADIPGRLIGLIDYTVLDDLGMHHSPQACADQKGETCRNLFCSFGKLRDRAGKCRIINKVWYNQHFVIVLKLTTNTSIDLKELFLDDNGMTKQTAPAYKSHWKHPWTITIIRCFREHFERGKTQTLFVYLAAEFAQVDPSKFLERTGMAIDREFLIYTIKQTYSFNTTLMENVSFVSRSTTIVFGNSTKTIDRAAYRLLYLKRTDTRNPHHITKLQFCNQVELRQSEFVLSDDKTVLFNDFTKNILYSGEFTLLEGSNGNVTARVCIEDSGLHIVNHFELSKGNSVSLCKSGFFLTIFMVALKVF